MELLMKIILLNCVISAAAVFGSFGCRKSEADFIAVNTITKTDSISVVIPIPDLSQDSSIISYYDFDSSRGKWFEESMYFPYSSSLSDSIKRKGRALKVELHKGDNIRAELGTDPALAPKEGWYGFSLFFPHNYENDISTESIVQFQAQPDFNLGETWRSAPLFLGVLNDRMILEIRTDANKVTQQGKYTFERMDLGPVIKNEWLDFVFHIKWAYNNTGVVELWKNNKLIYSRINKPNCYNDILFPYFKIGIYKWDWEGKSPSTTTKRTIYIDEVRIGNSKANYNKVYPGFK